MIDETRKIRLIMELRRQGITDTRVLGAMERVPREAFVPESFVERAYENVALPIARGQTISQPAVVGCMSQAARIGSRMKVLEIGTGSGYQTAVLSKLCRRVYTIERHRDLLREAEARFAALRLHNITTHHGDGGLGWPAQAPFDRIIVTAAAEELPRQLLDQLTQDGIMIIPLGRSHGDQELVRCTKTVTGPEIESLWHVRFVPLLSGVSD